MNEQSDYVELVRISDPVQADLLAAFLEDGDVEFQVVNRSGAGFMSQLIPRAANPVVFRILEDDLERGKVLLEEYHILQSALPSDDTEDDSGDGQPESAFAAESTDDTTDDSDGVNP